MPSMFRLGPLITKMFIGFLHIAGHGGRVAVVGDDDIREPAVHGQADGIHVLEVPPQGQGTALLGQLGQLPLQEEDDAVLVEQGIVLRPGDAAAAGSNDQAGQLAQLGQDGGLLGPEGLLPGFQDVIPGGHA